MHSFMENHLKFSNLYPHRLAGALSLTRVLCESRQVSYIHQLVTCESVFEDVVLNIVVNMKSHENDDDNDDDDDSNSLNMKMTTTRLVSESFKILIALRARLEEEKKENLLWNVVRRRMVLILSTIVDGIENAANRLDSKVRDEICETAVYLFKSIEDDETECDILSAFNRVLVNSEAHDKYFMKQILMPICRLPVRRSDNKKQVFALRRLVTMRCTLWMATEMRVKGHSFSKIEVVSVVKMLHQFVSISNPDLWTDEIASLTQSLVHVDTEYWTNLWSVKECRECFQSLCHHLIEFKKREGTLSKLRIIVSENRQGDEMPLEWFLKEIENEIDSALIGGNDDDSVE